MVIAETRDGGENQLNLPHTMTLPRPAAVKVVQKCRHGLRLARAARHDRPHCQGHLVKFQEEVQPLGTGGVAGQRKVYMT